MTSVDGVLRAMLERSVPRDSSSVSGADWAQLKEYVAQIDRLMGSAAARKGRWGDLHRHLAFAEGCDFHNILEDDWPSVQSDIESAFFDESEPIPVVGVTDLSAMVAERPSGPITTALRWSALDDKAFERLIFCILSEAPGYENPTWLTNTNAPDRGRDLAVTRVVDDPLCGVARHRVIVQCKHWQSKPVGINEVTILCQQMKLWEPPPVSMLVIATTGRFSTDAVQWIESHNGRNETPRIEMWPDSHLERLLARRAHLVAEFSLR